MVALFNFIKIAIIHKHTDNKRLIASLTKQKALYLRCLIKFNDWINYESNDWHEKYIKLKILKFFNFFYFKLIFYFKILNYFNVLILKKIKKYIIFIYF